MLTINVPPADLWDERSEEFVSFDGGVLELEHSLVSISKWESKWHKPFLNRRESKTTEQIIDYIRCMCLNEKSVDPTIFNCLTKENVNEISAYIENPMTATWFRDEEGRKSGIGPIITSERIYYWMVAATIPFEAQYWHINRLLTLIRVCGEENKAGKNKKPKRQSMRDMAALNEARRKAMGTTG